MWVIYYEQERDSVCLSASLDLGLQGSIAFSSPFYLLALAIARSRPRGNKVKGRKEEGEKRVIGSRGPSKMTTRVSLNLRPHPFALVLSQDQGIQDISYTHAYCLSLRSIRLRSGKQYS